VGEPANQSAVDPEAAVAAAAEPVAAVSSVLDSYTAEAPSAQQAVDVFAGEWWSRLPDELGVISGELGLFEDSRIVQLLEWIGDADGVRILELGPLEGGHTYMLDRAGAVVDAIESNSRSYLKCLVVKELLGLRRARFMRGDFVAYLRQSTERYDLVLASGVLYHMVDPLELLDLLARASDRIAVWTHYYDAEILANSPTAEHFQVPAESVTVDGRIYQLHPRRYLDALDSSGFGGGPKSYARWMERQDILDTLARLGFDKIEIAVEDVEFMPGPCFLLFAERTRTG
jgi:hypothetical protein